MVSLYADKEVLLVNEEKLQQIFKDALMLYVKCLRHGMATQLAKAWADKPNGWYAFFLEVDYENAKTANKAPITAEVDSIYEFDFQACNKTMQYLKEVRDTLYASAGVTKSLAARINPYYGELITFRNVYVGHENYTQKQRENYRDEHNKALEKMHLILQNAFHDVVDPESADGKTFLEQFEVYRLAYINECQSKAYYLSDHMDLTKYDAAKFLPTCKKLGIDTDVVDDKYIFYTNNLNDTLAILRNFMAKNGDGQISLQSSPVAPVEKKSRVWYVVLIAVVVLVLLLGAVLEFTDRENVGGNSNSTSETAITTVQTTQSGIQQQAVSTTVLTTTQTDAPTTAVTTLPPTSNSKTNQIPQRHEAKVLALQHADEGRIHLMTLNTTVGGLVTPPAASTWGTGTIYSQNTNVAIAEGLLVRGVSVGETYIAYESDGLCVVYRVVVAA